jgi:16S rRNA (guanine527-N7)-methyltransferase
MSFDARPRAPLVLRKPVTGRTIGGWTFTQRQDHPKVVPRTSTVPMEIARIRALLAPFYPQSPGSALAAAVAVHLELLLRWNERMNLTAVRDPEEIVRRHFGESLFAAARLFPAPAGPGVRVIDVGSGAGFPGLPIRMHAPVALTLIESRQKKATFLREVVRALGYRDVEVFAGRAEEYPPPPSPVPVTVTLRAVERFEDALAAAARIAAPQAQGQSPSGQRRLALLIGAGQVARARELVTDFAWKEPLPIPHSQSRVLLVGSYRG